MFKFEWILIGCLFGCASAFRFKCPRPVGLFAVEDSCHVFYQCDHNIAHKKFCPPGSLYDGGRHECVNRHEDVKCGPQPSTEAPVTTPDPNAPSPCDPSTCILPYCFCSVDGTKIPGGLARKETPQMIMLTFDGAVNHLNFDKYNTIFLDNRTNPDGCPIKGTFFMTHEYSDYAKVQGMYSKGHEMAVASVSRRIGLENEDVDAWVGEMVTMREILHHFANVVPDEVIGMRAPNIKPGRNTQFEVIYDYGFFYDSSMVVPPIHIPIWPYTLDHEIPHECKSGTCPTGSFPGIWEFPMNSHFQNTQYDAGYCPYLDQCGFNHYRAVDLFNWLKDDFHRYYNQNRAPYMLSMSVNFFNTKELHDGLLMFIDYTLTLPEVYYTTMTETLQWMSEPQPLNKLSTFAPFDCKSRILPDPPCNRPKSCPLVLDGTLVGVKDGGTRYMTICGHRCPNVLPWIYDHKGLGRGHKDVYAKVEF